jgi:uncharacterized protein YukE
MTTESANPPQTDVIDGKVIQGTYQDGAFFSSDGHWYVPPGGAPEAGITDPVTHEFLQGGVIRTVDGVQMYGTVSDGDFYSEDGKVVETSTGRVYHGYTQVNGNSEIFVADIDGQQVPGSFDGASFYSLDGKEYIPPTGPPESGITDPATGDFLQNGVTKTVDGHLVYGTVQGGDFYSDDGTIVVTSADQVYHGYTQTVGSDSYFVLDVDGKEYAGGFNQGTFYSNDGTLVIPPNAPPEFGITDPATGDFLQNGVTKTVDGHLVYGTAQNGNFYSDDGTIVVTSTGQEYHGYTQTVGSDSYFVTEVDGKEYAGGFDAKGDFYSKDGTLFIPAGGPPEFGITDPVTGDFVENGVTRTVDGQVVYGSVQDGNFYSDDGKIVITSAGQEYQGHAETVGSQTLFVIEVDGKSYAGGFGSDGTFMSADGTMIIPPFGSPEFGVTDPNTGQFIQGGTTLTMPDGTVLYGYSIDGAFMTYDGTEIVLNGNDVLHGTYDTQTGIFTATNGDTLFVGQNGIQLAFPQPDGSYELGDGSIIMTPQSWTVDLAAMSDAIATTKTNADGVTQEYANIVSYITNLQQGLGWGGSAPFAGYWVGPAADTFNAVTEALYNAMSSLDGLLADVVSQLEQSYQNYVAAEAANTRNLSA